jgi:lysophospholipase L1-like esterase
MNRNSLTLVAAFAAISAFAQSNEISKYDERMAIENSVVSNNVKWIDGKFLPIEGRMFDDVEHYYDRLPSNVTAKVNGGVRSMKHHTSGMMFHFVTDSRKLHFKWIPYNKVLGMHHMPSTGVSGIDIYAKGPDGKWRYVKTGSVLKLSEGGSCSISWTPGTPCLVNLPLYNGIKSFTLGVDPSATVKAPGPRKSGVDKTVVFYGTSITHGGCCSRPGLSFVNMIGRDLDVPVVNLGFSGSGRMEFEMSKHLAAIDASCYVLDCLWNMNGVKDTPDYDDIRDRKNPICVVVERYEPFIRALRAARPGVPIVMAEQCDVHCRGPNAKDKFIRALYEKLIKEGWTDLVYLPKTDMYSGDTEGTVDGCHPNDIGMATMAKAFGGAVKEALKLK